MAIGQLSPDEQRYVDQLSAATGLDKTVVTAWVGSESGWNTYKPDHNYLNIGPGRTFVSTDAAAAGAAGLINTSSNYGGIRNAIPAGPGAQVSAIGSSPWGTDPKTLSAVFGNLGGASSSTVSAQPAGLLGNVGGDVTSAVTNALGKVLDPLVAQMGEMALALLFSAGAIALIGFGIAKVTARPVIEATNTVNDVTNKAQSVAKLATVV